MIIRIVLILVIGFMSIIVNADMSNDERNKIRHSEPFWKMYTDALRGNEQAQFEVGVMFERGIGVDLNQTQAAKWYEKAAIQGHKDAQFNIGIMYASGRGVEKNDLFAMMWLGSAAKQGDKESRALLLELIDGELNSNSQSSSVEKSTTTFIKAIRFETKEDALICRSLNDNRQCSRVKEKQTFTSKSKQGKYYKISGIIIKHGWQAYEGDGFIETSMVEIK